MAKEKIITALDIGTTKICCLISKIDSNNQIKICGVGESKSEGLSQGKIINIQTASRSIDKAIKAAEDMAESGMQKRGAKNIFVGVAGELIQSFDSHGIAKIESKRKDTYEITEYDVEKVIEDAKNVTSLPADRRIIHTEPQYFSIDGQTGISNPIGMNGLHLGADVHIVTADINSLTNVYTSVSMLGLNVKDVVLQPMASAMAVLNKDAKDLGSILVDIGGGTTDISVYYKQSIRYSCIIPVGGENITRDLSIGLRTPFSDAEKIKIEYGFALPEDADADVKINVPGIAGHASTTRTQKFIAEIINPRMGEITQLALNEMKKSRYLDMMTAGIFISGGAANLRSTSQLFEKNFKLQAKTGYPYFDGIYGETDTLNDPKYATVVGLLYWGKRNFDKEPFSKELPNSIIDKMISRTKRWFAARNFT